MPSQYEDGVELTVFVRKCLTKEHSEMFEGSVNYRPWWGLKDLVKILETVSEKIGSVRKWS